MRMAPNRFYRDRVTHRCLSFNEGGHAHGPESLCTASDPVAKIFLQ